MFTNFANHKEEVFLTKMPHESEPQKSYTIRNFSPTLSLVNAPILFQSTYLYHCSSSSSFLPLSLSLSLFLSLPPKSSQIPPFFCPKLNHAHTIYTVRKMGSETEELEPSSEPKLPLFLTIPPKDPSLPSGMLTPPLHTSASVPFRWEEEPGKPRPCTALIPLPPNNTKKGLELPPRLVLIESSKNLTKTPSPTTVLDGPDYMGKSVFSSSSFRFSRTRERRQGSFDSNCSTGSPTEAGPLLLGPMILGSKKEQKGRRLFGSFRLGTIKLKTGKKEASGGSSVISSSSFSSMEMSGSYDDYDDTKSSGGIADTGEEKMGKNFRRNGSFSSLSHTTRSHFWAAIYDGFKHVVPWKSRKSKKEGLIV